jgi:MFS family permease
LSNASVPSTLSGPQGYDRSKLYWLSVVALFTAGMAFAIRGGVTSNVREVYFTPFFAADAEGMVTGVMSLAFLGFAFTVLIGSPLCDTLGMGKLLMIACVLFLVGTLVTIFTPVSTSAKSLLMVGIACMGLGHGFVEASINPLIATLYPEDKTHKLNVLHSWWPGGIIGGSMVSLLDVDWKIKVGLIMVPAILFGVMLIGAKFPPTERVSAGVSSSAMYMEAFKPLFIVLFCCMLMTASLELAPGAWVDSVLTRTVGMRGIILVAYVSGLMFVMRYFAGPLAHRLSPIGLMWFSSALAGIGLFLLSLANTPVLGILAATVWGIGVCYMWPTMLAITSERFPKGGAFLMGIMGSAGSLAIYFLLPKLGAIFDAAKVEKAGGEEAFKALQAAADPSNPATMGPLNEVLSYASLHAFQMISMLAVVLVVVFGAIWLYDKSRGGYKAEVLVTDAEPEATPL